jgi:hypothetical protein
VVLLTADHGFTYGPALGSETHGRQRLDGRHRCVEVAGRPAAQDLADESIAYLDCARLSLPKSYLAAVGRRFGRDTVSGWCMSHGGLLPEEVIIPAVEWFGDRAAMAWPVLTVPDGALFDGGFWRLTVRLQNAQVLPIYNGAVQAAIAGSPAVSTSLFARIEPGQHASVEISLRGENIPEGASLPVEVTVRQRSPRADTEAQRVELLRVQRSKRLMERTVEQADFENMF